MAHVKIKMNPHGTTQEERFGLVVDGVDIGKHVLADGFAINPGSGLAEDPPTLTIRLAATMLDLDLPAAVVEALAPIESQRGME